MSERRFVSSRKKIPKRGGVRVAGKPTVYAGILFCLIFAGAGLSGFLPSIAPWFWKSTPCEVLEFEIHDNPDEDPPFSAEARYRFDWNGKPHESGHVGIRGWKDARVPLELARKFSENPKTVCYLPDGSSESAVLLRPAPKWGSLFIIGFGASMAWLLFQGDRTRDLPEEEVMKRVLPPVALLFGIPGLLLFLNLSLPVWIESIAVLGWNETPAEIVWSELRVTHGTKSTSYRADVCYEYEAAGRTWRNNRVRAGETPESGRSAATEILRLFAVGRRTHCHVHPTRPERAVLLTSPGWVALFTLFPLPFLAIGLWTGWEALRMRAPSARVGG
ncbi:DUF3592 domain-containing protein [Luteolibacter yonseiensis]